ncbi:MAG: hypothetical protein QXE80_03375 [Pyrobaculum sp.]
MIVGGIDYEGTQFTTFAEPTRVIFGNQILERTTGSQTAPQAGTFGWQNYVCYLPSAISATGRIAVAVYEATYTNPVYLANLSSASLLHLTIANNFKPYVTVQFSVNDQIYTDFCELQELKPGEKVKISFGDFSGLQSYPSNLIISYDGMSGPSLSNPLLLSTVTLTGGTIRKILLADDYLYVLMSNSNLYLIPFGTSQSTLIETGVYAMVKLDNKLYYVKEDGTVKQVTGTTTKHILTLPTQQIRAADWKDDLLVVVSANSAVAYKPETLATVANSSFQFTGQPDVAVINNRDVALSTGDGRTVVFWDLQLGSFTSSYSTSASIIGLDSIDSWLIITMPASVEVLSTKDFSVKRTISRTAQSAQALVNYEQKLVFVDEQVVDLNSTRPLFFGYHPAKVAWLAPGKGVNNDTNVVRCYRV